MRLPNRHAVTATGIAGGRDSGKSLCFVKCYLKFNAHTPNFGGHGVTALPDTLRCSSKALWHELVGGQLFPDFPCFSIEKELDFLRFMLDNDIGFHGLDSFYHGGKTTKK